MPDLYFFRDQEDIEKEEQAAALAAAKPEETYTQDWASAPVDTGDWAEAPAATTTTTTTTDVSKIKFVYVDL